MYTRPIRHLLFLACSTQKQKSTFNHTYSAVETVFFMCLIKKYLSHHTFIHKKALVHSPELHYVPESVNEKYEICILALLFLRVNHTFTLTNLNLHTYPCNIPPLPASISWYTRRARQWLFKYLHLTRIVFSSKRGGSEYEWLLLRLSYSTKK